jgi:hypothetical protein
MRGESGLGHLGAALDWVGRCAEVGFLGLSNAASMQRLLRQHQGPVCRVDTRVPGSLIGRILKSSRVP